MIVVDVQTSGLNPRKHSILSIGAVEFEHSGNTFYIECQVDPDAAVEAKALEVNGFTEEQIVDPSKPTLKEALEKWLDWAIAIPERTLAGHNTAFDYAMLEAACRKYDLGWPFGSRTVDLHSLAYADYYRRQLEMPKHGGASGITAPMVFEYVGLEPGTGPLNGLEVAKKEAEALSRFMSGKTIIAEYGKFVLPEHLRRS